MEIWFKIIHIYTLWIAVENAMFPCGTKESPSRTQQVICWNLTSSYMESVGMKLTRTVDWFTCDYCQLRSLNSRILNFSIGHLVYLNLTQCQVEDIRDAAFMNNPVLKLLILKKNKLKNLNKGVFYGLPKLLQLDLSWNMLESLQDNLFLHLENLDILNLNQNKIRVLEMKAFNGLTKLKYLYINSNEITTIHPHLFKFLVELKMLYIEYNKIKDISQMSFTNLNKLEFLYLNNNSLELLTGYIFKQLPSLIDLQLRNNSINEISTSSFNGLRKLKFLSVGGNNINKIAKRGFVGLDSLLVLELIGNHIHYFSLDVLSDMPYLKVIWLENNGLKNVTASRSTRPHDNLMSLGLKTNELSFFNYKIIYRKLKALRELILSDNCFKCEFFVPMQDYLDDRNVTLCMDDKCDPTETAHYVEQSCKLGFNFSTSGYFRKTSGPIIHYIFAFLLLHMFY